VDHPSSFRQAESTSSQERPKITLVVDDLSSAVLLRALLIARALQRLHYPTEICGFHFRQHLYTQLPEDIPVVAFGVSRWPKALWTAQQLIRRLQGSLIYAIKPRPLSYGVALISKWFKSHPVLLDIDDWEIGLFQTMPLLHPNHPLYLRGMQALIPQANAITINSSDLQSRFGGSYLPNGKDTELFDPARYDAQALRQRYGLADYTLLMFPGAPRPYKGLEDLLAALDLLQNPRLRLVIIGGSPYDNYDAQLMEQWGNWIIKLPRMPYEQMPEIVAASHIVVVPQRDHPATRAQFPLKLTDGMAMAKPILSTCVGDIPRILGGTGYLVDPSSPHQLAEKLSWILAHNDEANQLGQQARQRCIQFFSLEAMAQILHTVVAGVTA
jgi:glycosyltransferase involved in cell wall biosynthesis